jgi:predicted DNA-binding protein YlxM (UPF0122 family)
LRDNDLDALKRIANPGPSFDERYVGDGSSYYRTAFSLKTEVANEVLKTQTGRRGIQDALKRVEDEFARNVSDLNYFAEMKNKIAVSNGRLIEVTNGFYETPLGAKENLDELIKMSREAFEARAAGREAKSHVWKIF